MLHLFRKLCSMLARLLVCRLGVGRVAVGDGRKDAQVRLDLLELLLEMLRDLPCERRQGVRMTGTRNATAAIANARLRGTFLKLTSSIFVRNAWSAPRAISSCPKYSTTCCGNLVAA